jgi:hypothetical protein
MVDAFNELASDFEARVMENRLHPSIFPKDLGRKTSNGVPFGDVGQML